MNNLYKAFAKKLFGAKYERLKKTLPIYLILFWGLRTADFRIPVAPLFLYLMTGTFTAGVMWQALSSEDHAANMQNIFMLPFENRRLIFSYVSALGAYTLLTKTAGLLAAVSAVTPWDTTKLLGSLLCGANAILMTACIYSWKMQETYARARNEHPACTAGPGQNTDILRGHTSLWGKAIIRLLWVGIVIAGLFLLWDKRAFLPVSAGNILLAILFLSNTDAYSFYVPDHNPRRTVRNRNSCSIWRYLLRYLSAHKNYLVNTVAMWSVACILPAFLGQIKDLSVMPIGFAILTLNTPVCILLSCDRALEQAVRFLPGQKKAFCIPYCLFLFLCNILADVIFLGSWQLQNGGVTGAAILTAVFFALQSAVGSVLLEWFRPVQGWKIESDLWHHPRKYVVPATMLLLAGALGTMPGILPVLLLLLAVEIIVLLSQCRKE